MAVADSPQQASPELVISDRQKLTVLYTAIFGHAVKHFFASAIFVLLPELKTGLDLNNAQVGILSTARNFAGGVANLPAGFAADRYPARRAEILGVSIAGIGVFAFLLGITSDYWLVVIAASILAAVISFWHPSALGSLSQLFADRRGFAISLHGSGGSVGEALGPMVTGFLLGSFAWQTLFQGSLAPAIALGIVIWMLLRAVPAATGSVFGIGAYLRGVGGLLANRRLLLVLLFAGGFAGGQSVVQTFLPIFLRENQQVSSASVGLYLALAQVVGIGAQPIMGYVSDHWGRRIVIVPALAVLGVCYALLSVAPAGAAFISVVAIMGAFLYSLMSIFLAASIDVVQGEVQATTVSLVFGVATAVSGIAPGIAGVLADSYGIGSAFLFAAALVIFVGVVAMVTSWQREPAGR